MVERFPAIDEREFADGCQQLERRCHDRLDGTNWLGVTWTGEELRIRQSRNYAKPDDRVLQREGNADQTSSESQDEDEHELPASISDSTVLQNTLTLHFSVLLSPIYRVPVLWFVFAPETPSHLRNLQAVYDHLVPQDKYESLRSVGVMGGLSTAYHPVTGFPAFFIHPCNTPEALLDIAPDKNIDAYAYLLLWLGLTGPAVGLHVPSKLVAS